MDWIQFFCDAGLPEHFALKYASIFAENRIRPDMLPDLNKEYLRDMGIGAMGDMIAILKHARRVSEELLQKFEVNPTPAIVSSSSVDPPPIELSKISPLPACEIRSLDQINLTTSEQSSPTKPKANPAPALDLTVKKEELEDCEYLELGPTSDEFARETALPPPEDEQKVVNAAKPNHDQRSPLSPPKSNPKRKLSDDQHDWSDPDLDVYRRFGQTGDVKPKPPSSSRRREASASPEGSPDLNEGPRVRSQVQVVQSRSPQQQQPQRRRKATPSQPQSSRSENESRPRVRPRYSYGTEHNHNDYDYEQRSGSGPTSISKTDNSRHGRSNSRNSDRSGSGSGGFDRDRDYAQTRERDRISRSGGPSQSSSSSNSSRSRISDEPGYSRRHENDFDYDSGLLGPRRTSSSNGFATSDSARSYANRNNKYASWGKDIPLRDARYEPSEYASSGRSGYGDRYNDRSRDRTHDRRDYDRSPPRYGHSDRNSHRNSPGSVPRHSGMNRDEDRDRSREMDAPLPRAGERLYETLDSRYKCKSEKISRNYDGPMKLRPSFFL